jgi:hypothetical protein
MRDAVEAGRFAFAPLHDPRVQTILQTDTNLAQFLQRFTDAFGMQLQPVVYIFEDRGDRPGMGIVANLRDALSMSVIPGNYARVNRGAHTLNFGYSDAFDFYPWMPGNDNDGGMTAFTPALRAFHIVSEFGGQSSPLLSVQMLSLNDIEWTLFDELVVRCERRYAATRPEWADIALFRSLDMANAAAKIPAGRDMTEFSSGRTVASWISAFEILVHPGPQGRVGIYDVYRHLESVQWQTRECSAATHPAYNPNRPPQMRNLACWIYGELYRARNDFAHGNPVDANRLRLPSGRYLHYYAAILYRLALTGFLNLQWTQPANRNVDTGFPQAVDMWDPQYDLERALATTHLPPR